jgi:hypothetical protein
VHGVGEALAHDKKSPWPPLPFYVGAYSFKDIKEGVVEVESLVTFHFEEEIFKQHDPLDVVNQHCKACKYRWPYQNEVW